MSGRSPEVPPHEHDWRINPNVILWSNPPAEELVCADCGARSSRPVPGAEAVSNDVRDWPRA